MTATTLTAAPAVHARLGIAYSADGDRLGCLAARADGRYTAELWTLRDGAPERAHLPAAGDAETPRTQCLPLPDGRLLLCRGGGGRHDLLTATPGDDRPRPLGTVHHAAVRLLPWPGRDALAVLVTTDGDRRSTLRLLTGPGPELADLAGIPGGLLGGSWLDRRHLAGLVVAGGAAHGAIVDTATGRTTPLPGAEAGERLLLTGGGRALVAVPTAGGGHRLGLRPLDGSTPTAYPDGLNSLPGTVRPLAIDPSGGRLAVRSGHGAVDRLLVHDLATDTAVELPSAPGTFGDRAHWGRAGLQLIHSTPDTPAAPVTVPGRHRARPAGRPSAALREVAGSEAVVYGDPWTAERAVLALHGGPSAAWRYEFDPLLREFAAAGIAVVALNQRGSTGYGAAHRDAIRDDWGGPDLDDVQRAGRELAAWRTANGLEAPALYGISYGAWLAVLAAAGAPDRWSRCAAVAPFLSVPRLAAAGSPGVRSLLDRLAAPAETAAERDLYRQAERIRVPLLLLHGERDEVVPVGQSRELRDRLLALGRRPGTDFAHREIPGAGHYPPGGPGGAAVRTALTDFLRTGAL
ncbi:alpha/beta hydrolase family protein [Kitasatospora terrestris]|uniref:Peptidase S9 prolyl oligopeptidase catalytic domain-containing protein n=1 Tax=Kitasatospora terrestris TaxID=258051 RepID=A0ABP9EN13_9ACTN